MELSRKDKIVKGRDKYTHIITCEYPKKNVENLLKSWKENINQYNEWLDNYDNKVEEARKAAVLTFEESVKNIEEEVTKILGMSDEERLKYWNEIFLQQCKDLEESKKNKEDIIKKLEKQNLDLLNKYKQQYQKELKNKKEAIKLWTK